MNKKDINLFINRVYPFTRFHGDLAHHQQHKVSSSLNSYDYYVSKSVEAILLL